MLNIVVRSPKDSMVTLRAMLLSYDIVAIWSMHKKAGHTLHTWYPSDSLSSQRHSYCVESFLQPCCKQMTLLPGLMLR